MRKISCIGSGNAHERTLLIVAHLGEQFLARGFLLATGNCQGIEQAFVSSANAQSPENVHLFLPWNSYERLCVHQGNVVNPSPYFTWVKTAQSLHPGWKNLSVVSKKLYARIVGAVQDSSHLITYEPDGAEHTTTTFAIKLAETLQIPVLNLFHKKDFDQLKRYDITIPATLQETEYPLVEDLSFGVASSPHPVVRKNLQLP